MNQPSRTCVIKYFQHLTLLQSKYNLWQNYFTHILKHKHFFLGVRYFLSHAALPVPAPPTNLRVTFINSTSVTISWQAPPPDPTVTIASYRLVVSETEFGLNDTVASATMTSYTFTGLEEYNNYTCSVVAVSTYGAVSNETVISFTTPQGGIDCLSVVSNLNTSFISSSDLL